MSSSSKTITLQLMDIIELEAPSNASIHKQRYLIEYIDKFKFRLQNIDNIENPPFILHIKDNGEIDHPSITKIMLLNRDPKFGYAKQNNLLPNTVIDIYFNGDEPLIVTGTITCLLYTSPSPRDS